MTATAKQTVLQLEAYCRENNWAGYDPYDALNSRLFAALPFLNSRLPRLALTQALKRSPVNIRPLLLVPRTQNPKAIALFLQAYLKLSQLGLPAGEDFAGAMIERLVALRSQEAGYWCWGYSFPWQTRTIVVPRGAANLVCTTFAGDALLEAYEHRKEPRCLEMAVSAAEYLLRELYWEEGGRAGFAYPLATERNQVHNANFLGAALLCRAYQHTGNQHFRDAGLRAARSSAAQQAADGSWPYGELATQQWIDNFHTGFNLCALRSIGQALRSMEFAPVIRRGLDFYRAHFFRADGAPRYFHNHTCPIDIHSVAQSIITLMELKDFDAGNERLAQAVFAWALQHMWDPRGFFYYRVLRFGTIRTSYMRWSQAWMLLALATLLSGGTKEPATTARPQCEAVV